MKKLTVNCATCDARSVTQQTLESFESIMINAATIITTPASKVLMAQYHVTMNCANALTLDEDAELITVNGKSEIKPSDAVTGKKYLVVNGKVSIAPGSEKVLEHYVGMLINGKVICPESLSGALGMMTVNGKTVVYPDGAVILEGSTVINKLFTLRAKNKLYWADKRLIMADPQLDPAALAAKGASFSAPEVIITESLVDGLLPLIDEKADIQVVPDGTTVVDDDVKLTNGTIRRYGDKIYVLNDFEAGKDSAEALERIEYLHICGDAEVDAQVEELFYQKAEIEGEVTVLSPDRGRCLSDLPYVKVTNWMLSQAPDGLRIEDCVVVELEEDIAPQDILSKLSISDCAKVQCTPDQESAVTMVSSDVSRIGSGSPDQENAGEKQNTTTINCAAYTL